MSSMMEDAEERHAMEELCGKLGVTTDRWKAYVDEHNWKEHGVSHICVVTVVDDGKEDDEFIELAEAIDNHSEFELKKRKI